MTTSVPGSSAINGDVDTSSSDREHPPRDAVSETQRTYLTALFLKYRGPLQRYLGGLVCSSDDAAELVQESYFRLMRHAEMTHVESIARSYLFQTATNLARDYHRRRAARRARMHVPIDDEATGVSDELTPEGTLIWEQSLSQLKAGLRDMPSQLRDVFMLSRFRQKTYPEIATMLGVSTRTVERRMCDAMAFLSKRIGAVL
jgi:RNA polymerase sigma factor (sigma-70 family)